MFTLPLVLIAALVCFSMLLVVLLVLKPARMSAIFRLFGLRSIEFRTSSRIRPAPTKSEAASASVKKDALAYIAQWKSLTVKQSRDLLEKVRTEGNIRDYALIALLITTGLRTVEVTRARRADVQHISDLHVLSVWGKGRTKRDQHVRIPADVYAVYEAYKSSERASEWLFPGQKQEDPLTTRQMRRIVSRWMNAVGIEGHGAHSLRHTAATLALQAGHSLESVQRMLRHANVNTTAIYLQAALMAEGQSESVSEVLGISQKKEPQTPV